MEIIVARTAGASRGNPGPAAASVSILAQGKLLKEVKVSLGNAGHSFAGYYGVMLALQTCTQLYGEKTREMQFEITLDDEVVKKQLSAELQITEPGLVPMFIEIHNLRVSSFPNLQFIHVRQELNSDARRLVNETLEGK